MLDTFSGANGTIGAAWDGATSGYAISSNQWVVNTGEDIYWAAASYGSEQEAYVTVSSIAASAAEIDDSQSAGGQWLTYKFDRSSL